MPTLVANPPLTQAPPPGPFVQSISLREGDAELASALWCVTFDPTVVQILHMHVDPAHRRGGSGGQVFDEIVRQAKLLNQLRQTRLRRIWIAIEQKSQVVGRAFFTQHGFHHTTTINNLLKSQDALVYQKAYD